MIKISPRTLTVLHAGVVAFLAAAPLGNASPPVAVAQSSVVGSAHPGGSIGIPGLSVPSAAGATRDSVPPAGPAQPPVPGSPASQPSAPFGAPPPVAETATGVLTLITALERDENDWRIWWRLNRDPYLKIDPSSARPLSDDGDLGLSAGNPGRDRSRVVSPHQVLQHVLPALERALHEETSASVRSAILIALGRAGTLGSERCARRVLALCADTDHGVAEAALVAAGLEASALVVPRLVHVMHGCEQGVAILGGRSVDTRAQALTALALGLGVRRSTNEDLRRFVLLELARSASAQAPSADLPVACVASVGLLPLPWRGDVLPGEARPEPHASREGQISWLLAAVAVDEVYREVRGHATLALGRLAEGASPPWRETIARALLARLDDPRAPVEVRQSAAVALGEIGDCDEDGLDRAIRAALIRTTRNADALSRRLALMAVARVGTRDGFDPQGSEAGRRELRGHLLATLARGPGGLDAWAALGLGLLEHELVQDGFDTPPEVHLAIEEALVESRSPVTAGAFGLALALSAAPDAVAPLALALERHQGEESAAAALSIALGLSGGIEARELLIDRIATTRGRPALLHDAALGLALAGDFDGTPHMLRALESTAALDSRAALASALGRSGDSRAIQTLLEALADQEAPQADRTLAARALGWLVDQGGPPVWSPLSCDLNWGADTTTLAAVDGGDFLALLRDF